MQNLTIFTDASHCPDTKVAGGAFWSRTEDKFLKDAYAYHSLPQSNDAEIAIAIDALAHCLSSEVYKDIWLPDEENVLIILVVDCLGVKHAMERRASDLWADPIKHIRADIASRGARLKINHVKGHSNTGKPRNWVNNWCDREARKKMKFLRDHVKQGVMA